jgi:hypothetical protein
MTTKEALAAADVTAVKEAAATVAEIKAAEAKAEAKKADKSHMMCKDFGLYMSYLTDKTPLLTQTYHQHLISNNIIR